MVKDEGFVEKVRDWWGSFSFVGSPSFVLAKKLRALKGEIKKWNSEVFGNVGARNRAWAEELELLDNYKEGRGLSREEKRAGYRFGSFSFTRGNLLEVEIKGPVVKGG